MRKRISTFDESSESHSTTGADPLGRATLGIETSTGAPLLVTVDGRKSSGAALRVASALAERDGIGIEAVLVEGVAFSGGEVCLSADALRHQPIPDTTRLGRVRQQLCAALVQPSWSLHITFGAFGPTIADVARRTGASLIVMGMSRHRPARRLLGSGAAARVSQSTQIPVLAVAATARGLPHAAVAAVDFSPASLRAARAARDVLASPGTLYLTNVRPPASAGLPELEGSDEVAIEGITIELQKLASDLTTGDVTVVPRVLYGDLIDSVLGLAVDEGAELVASGSNSLTAFEHLLLGHVPNDLLGKATCSVLIAPP